MKSKQKENKLFIYILLFFTLSVIGWIFEVLNEIRKGHGFIKRGVLHGPWLPIYGLAGILVYLLLKKYKEKPHVVFSLSFIICFLVEYLSSLYLEITKGIIWWDYSKKPLNLNGRVCFLYTLIFAIIATLVYYFIIPKLIKLFEKISYKVVSIICTILLVFFLVDNIYSTKKPNIVRGAKIVNKT
ncbi:MAG: putative ABC transporter permease [Bacilli bacterium]